MLLDSNINEELLFNINQHIENKNQNIYNKIISNKVSFGKVIYKIK